MAARVSPAPEQRHAEVVAGVGERGRQTHGPAKLLDRLCPFARREERRAKIVGGGGLIGSCGSGCAEMHQGFVQAPHRLERGSEIGVRDVVARILLQTSAHERFLEEVQVAALFRQHLNPQVSHLIRAAIARHDPARRLIRVSWVVARVVVPIAHRHDRALRQEQRLRQPVHGLPVQVPVLDVDHRLPGAVRQRDRADEILPEVVRVWIHREQFHVDGDGIRVGDLEIADARRDVERPIVLQLQQHREPGRRPVGEVQADRRLQLLRLARWLQVHVQNEIGPSIDPPRHVIGLERRRRPRLPEEKVAVRFESIGRDLDVHPFEPHLGIGLVASPRRARPVDDDVGVVDDTLVAGEDLDRPNVTRGDARHGEHEVPKHVLTLGGERVGTWHGQHHIRLPELPAFLGHRRGRRDGGHLPRPCAAPPTVG